MIDLKTYLAQRARLVEKELRRYTPKDKSLISQAMRYSLFAGGKRVRPALVFAGCEICGGKLSKAIPAACAVEYIHTYSLIHDDLPAMDNDDLRRGKATSHKKYGEATAILAGDALLTEAFGLLTYLKIPPARLKEVVSILSEAAGYKGMVGGQVMDTVFSGSWRKRSKVKARRMLTEIHQGKTAALIKASLLIGCEIAGGSRQNKKSLARYADAVGQAFQISDDILDIVGNKKLLGKKGSDRDNDKLTYPALYGIEGSKQKARKLTDEAIQSIKRFGRKAEPLVGLAKYIIERTY